MKSLKGIFGVLLTAAMSLSFTVQAQASAPDGYTYTIRVFAGKQGAIGGGASVEADKVTDGSVIFRQAPAEDSNAGYISMGGAEYAITLPTDSKYYVKGIKVSGSDTMANSNTQITQDRDYVVVYGVKGEQVEYTVQYLDENGNALHDADKYMGNIGDTPIIAYRYFEGYVPNAHNLTKTLDSIKENNVFTFYYRRLASGGGGNDGEIVVTEEVVTGAGTTTTVVAGGGTADATGGPVVIPGAAAAGGGAADAGAGPAVIPGAADAGAGAGGGAGAPVVEVPDEQAPQELINLDDEDVPLADTRLSGTDDAVREPGSFFVNLPPAVIVGIVSLAVLTVAAAWYLLFHRKKKGAEEKNKKDSKKRQKKER